MQPTSDQPDLTGKGVYTIDAVARLAQVRSLNARRWSVGRSGSYSARPILVNPAYSIDGSYYLTFQQLIEIHVIGQFRSHGVSTKMIRAATEIAARDYGVDHPFAIKDFFQTDGKRLFTNAAKKISGTKMSKRVMHEISTGQAVFEDIVRNYFVNIEFAAARAVRYWPLGQRRGIVIDPKRSFGRPIDATSGISTYVLYKMRMAGSPIDAIARWYDVPTRVVEAAIQFEESVHSVV